VGINCKPYETLSVGGNIFYTGDLIKPSDRRIKRNIQPLQQEHMQNIAQINLYQYERMDLSSPVPRYIPERGVIAQEVRQVLPTAVTSLGKARLPDGSIVDLLAVNHQDLLIETIGATQNLNTRTENISEKVENLEETTQSHNSLIQNLISIINYIQNAEQSHTTYSCNMLGMGPAWTMCILGFFFPPLLFIGSMYMFSAMRTRQVAGIVSFLTLASLVLYMIIFALSHPGNFHIALYVMMGSWGLGVIICCVIVVVIFIKRHDEQSPA